MYAGSQSDLIYYFYPADPGSYLLMSQMPALERRYGVQFDWRPLTLSRMDALSDRVDPQPVPPARATRQMAMESIAWADYFGVEFYPECASALNEERLALAVIAAGRQVEAGVYAWAQAQEIFGNADRLSESEVMDRVAMSVGLNLAQFHQDCAALITEKKLQHHCEGAATRFITPAPTLIVGDAVFAGHDRLVLAGHALGKRIDRPSVFAASGLDHVVLRSENPEDLASFYCRILSTRVERTVGDFLWQIRVGDSLLDIIRGPNSGSNEPNMDHFCLRIEPYDEAALLTYFEQQGVEAKSAGTIYGAQGMGPSLYVTDPEGNQIELKRDKSP